MGADRLDDALRKIAFRGKLVEPLKRRFDPEPPSLIRLGSIAAALATSGMSEAKRADHRGQQQALAYQRHQNNGKGEEKNEIAAGKRLTVRSCKRDREGRREGNDAAHPGER